MSQPHLTESTVKTPTGSGAESPTTVRPLDMDDDDVQDGGLAGEAPTTTPASGEHPPAKPPRPLSAQQQAENTLKEAFPSIDLAVVKAVLSASGGRVEPAFNALLGMSDPDAAIEPIPPPQPPRPKATGRMGSTPMSQVEADELYARQLAEHYDGGAAPRGPRGRGGQQNTGIRSNDPDEGRSFLDDDFPVIRENLRKGFLETQQTVNKTVNSWITQLKKKIDGDEDGGEGSGQGQHPNQGYGSRRSGDGRRSGDYGRYDADPQVLGDDFAGIQLNDDGTPARRSRPLANPDLFKPTPATPKADGRKVSFQNGPPEDIYSAPSHPPPKDASAGKQSKWQPMSAVDPSPINETDNDPFSLGDSEDENPVKDRVGGKEVKKDDAERLKSAAAEVSPVEPERRPEPAETTGTQNKAAADALARS